MWFRMHLATHKISEEGPWEPFNPPPLHNVALPIKILDAALCVVLIGSKVVNSHCLYFIYCISIYFDHVELLDDNRPKHIDFIACFILFIGHIRLIVACDANLSVSMHL